nr:gamma-crystallin D-like [Procambarus clarkii]XP_045606691.1 gamma-crystallin D-like [Procambarus clarkii]
MCVPRLSVVVVVVATMVATMSAACGPPFLELYEERAHQNLLVNLTADTSELTNYGDRTKSICGVGLWFLFEDPDYTVKSDFILDFSYGEYSCQDLDTASMDRVSSVRHAGAFDVCMDTLMLYHDKLQAGAQYLVFIDTENLDGVFNDVTTSLAITGVSCWTIYKDAGYSGTAACICPYDYDGWSYGLYEVSDINFPNDRVSSVRKGCHSRRVLKYSPKTL